MFHIADPWTYQTFSKVSQYWVNSEICIAEIYSFTGEIGIISK